MSEGGEDHSVFVLGAMEALASVWCLFCALPRALKGESVCVGEKEREKEGRERERGGTLRTSSEESVSYSVRCGLRR